MKKTLSILFVLSAFVCAPMMARAQVIIGGPSNLNNGNMDVTYAEVIVDNDPPGPDPGDFRLAKPAVWISDGSRAITGPYEDDLSSEPWAGSTNTITPITFDASGLDHPNGCGSGANNHDCGVFFKAFSGNATDGAATSHLYQDNPATAGTRYVLTGWAGAQQSFTAAGAELALEFLGAGDTVIGGDVINLMPTLFIDNGSEFDYKLYTANAVAPAGTLEVRARVSMIGGVPNSGPGGQAFVVDDFTLTAVPEPSSLLMAGLSLVGALGLRRRG
jgi:hypothetical protein